MAAEHVDVLIVGAGLSGVGVASHLRRRLPGKTFTILEARGALGGTWDLFRYPGVRSDSDMFTLGYAHKPWTRPKSISDGAAIRDYIAETAREEGITERIRFHHRVVSAEWSTPDARWTVTAERSDTGEVAVFTCSFLLACTGYYRYEHGYTPEFPGIERFGGTVVHPQLWPEDLDYTGKKVVVIGSGATAVTLVPSMAGTAEHVTMLQRSPSYVLTLGARDPIADALRKWLPARVAYPVIRWKNVLTATLFYQLSRRRPELVKDLLRKDAVRRLPAGYEVDKHFKPKYDPWDQRVCFVPDGDLFRALRKGTASIATDRIATFTETGIELESGATLDADVVVTATGLDVLMLGGMALSVDGEKVDPADHVAYKGMMLGGVPNAALAIGYTNASWTLKVDLTAQYVCRLLAHMDAEGLRVVTPKEPDASVERVPFLDLQAGYVKRAESRLPAQAARAPWRLRQNYPADVRTLRYGPVDDEVEFSR
ncbi:flavin-containing monooxygenase [Actinokineospora bangkokensis]|uniref:FAD-containing monooxygenase EthA n=1 Tax=Actinokineospora bangkokensis TaxID=1193682 RepID=A0A1Q9LPP6_9PSEU|nr:NAD(P)/FAD-dependent oxidoreductase [Actinokineospora bangkokensis]OLR94000.1 FAD-containing monooxygenase EthA [Actinokineospora bangkokensis]